MRKIRIGTVYAEERPDGTFKEVVKIRVPKRAKKTNAFLREMGIRGESDLDL